MHLDFEWIDGTRDLALLVAAIGDGPLAVDTEADSLHHYREKVCLVQLSFGGRNALVDPLSGVDLEPLRAPLEDRSRRKVLHGADYDVRILGRDFGFAPVGIFDTMVAARILGETAFGLAALAASQLGVELDKSHQKADWSRRPLPASMAAYAAADTHHLLDLAAILERRLLETGRLAWAEEEFRRVEAVRWREADSGDEPWRRVKGGSSLDRRGLAVLAELWRWRDAAAREKDRPPFKVLRDEALVAAARRRPASRSELEGIDGIFPGLVRSPAGAAILDAVRRGIDVPDGDLPEVRTARRERPDPELEKRVARLRAARDEAARALSLDPSVVATRAVLEGMQRRIDAGEDPAGTPDLRRWQWDLLRTRV